MKSLSSARRPMRARELARLCGVETKTVHNWVTRGLLPHFRTPGRHLRFDPDDVAAFLAQHGTPAVDAEPAEKILLVAASKDGLGMRRALEGTTGRREADPYRALLVLGRERPDLVILHPSAFRKVDVAGFVRSLRRELPEARIVWVGAAPPGLPRSVERVSSVGEILRRATRSAPGKGLRSRRSSSTRRGRSATRSRS